MKFTNLFNLKKRHRPEPRTNNFMLEPLEPRVMLSATPMTPAVVTHGHLGHAHTESDLSLWEPQRRVLWAGGLVYEGRIPELAQGRVTRWLQALQRLTALNPHTVVSAVMSTAPDATHPPQALEATRNYLQTLRTQLIQAMDNGWHARESQRIQSLEHTHWIGYKERHGFNVQRAWRELEPEWLDATPLVNYSVPDIRR